MKVMDLVIIGGGPTGLNCAISAANAGLNYVVIEKGVLVNSIYNFPTNMTFFSTSQKLEIGSTPFISHTDKPTRKEALEYYRRLHQAYKLNVRTYEEVEVLSPVEADQYIIRTNRSSYLTKAVIVATGYYDTPRLLGVPGENLPKVKHYYDDAHPYVDRKVLVVGAANSACDVALETFQKGAEVTMAIRNHEIYPKVKYWIRPNIENRIKEGSITAHFNTTVTAITPDNVSLRGPDGEFTIANDFVLAMTGYQPNYTLLERLGLPLSDDELSIPIHSPDTLETPLPNVYVAGVVCAGLSTSKLFIENTRDHGEVIVGNIIERHKTIHV